MLDLGKNFDGTLEKTVKAAGALSGKNKVLQDFMLLGDFKSGLAKKIDGTNFGDMSESAKNQQQQWSNQSLIENYAAQLATLDKSAQRVVFKATELNDGIQSIIQGVLDATAAGQKMNSVLFEKSASEYNAKQHDIDSMMFIGQMKNNNGMYKLTDYDKVTDRINKWANANKNADIVQRLLANGILETNNNVIQLDSSFLNYIKTKNEDINITKKQITLETIKNGVLQIGKQLLASLAISAAIKGVQWIYKELTEVNQKIADAATESKEHADALVETSSSLSDIVKQYEELGKKTTKTADDTEKLNSLQEQLTDLLKDQPGIGQDMLKQVNLQNASYETQLQLLKDIEKQQRKNTRKGLEEDVDDQGDLVVETYKKKVAGLFNGYRGGFKVGNGKTDNEIAKFVADSGVADFDEKTGEFKFNVDKDDPESIVNLYSNIGDALDQVSDKWSKEDVKSSKVVDGLKQVRKALKETVDTYTDASDKLHDNNLPDVTEGALAKLKNEKNVAEKDFKPQKEPFDTAIKQTNKYQEALTKLQETEEKFKNEGVDRYGNIDNLHRGKVVWNDETRSKFHDFAKENPDDVGDGEYSTILGGSDTVDGREIAFTPMLQLDDGNMIPLTEDQLWNYLDDIISQCEDEDGKIDFDKLLTLDATGLEKEVNGEIVRIKGMIAGVEGTTENGKTLTKADVMARAGSNRQEITQGYLNYNQSSLPKNASVDYTLDAERNSNDMTSSYVGKSMHDVQAEATEVKDAVDEVYSSLNLDTEEAYNKVSQKSKWAAKEQVSDYENIQNAIETLSNGVSSFDTSELTSMLTGDSSTFSDTNIKAIEKLKSIMSDMGFDPENTDDVAAFVDILRQLGVVAPSAAEKAKELAQRTKDAEIQMSEASTAASDLQKAYQTCKTAVEEYNKTGYVSFSTLQNLTALEPQYMSMLENSNGQLEINTETTQKLTKAMIAAQKAAILAKALTDIENTTTLDAANKILGEANYAIDNADKLLLQKENEAAKEAYRKGGMKAYDAVRRANVKQREAAETKMDLWDKLGDQDVDKILGKADKSRNSSSKTQKTALDAWSTLTSAMKEYNEQGYITMQTLKSLTDLEDKYTLMLKKNDTTGQLEMRTDLFYKLMKAELKEAQAKGDGASEEQYNRILEWTNRNIQKQTMSYYDLVAAIEGYSAALEEAKGKTDAFKDAWDNGKTVKEKLEKSRTGALDYEGTEAQSSALQTVKEYSQYDPKLMEKAYNQETGKIDLSCDVLKEAVTKSLREQATAARTEGGAAAEAIAQSYEKSAENIENDVISVQDYFDGLGASIEEASSKIDDLQSAWNDIDDVMDEYNAYGGLSIDSLQKLLTMSPEYLACLQMNGDQLVFNEAAMKQLLIDQIRSRAEFLASKDETKDQAQILYAMIDAIEHDGINAIKGMGTEAERLQSIFSSIKDVFSSLLDLVNSANDKKSNDLKIQGDAWIDVIDKRIDALNEANEAQERAIELQKAEDALAKAQNNKTVRVYGENGYEWQADASAVRNAQSDLSDKRREYKKQDEIDKLNKLKDKIQENINLIGTSWDDYQKKLAYTAQFEGMTYDEMIAHNDTFKDAVIANMKAVQAATNVSNIISKLETLIDVLTKLGNMLGRLNNSSTDGGITGLFNRLSRAFGTLTDKSSGKGFFGRLWDAGKSFLGIGSGTSKQIANEVASTVCNGVSNGMVEALGGAKVNAIKEANNIFSGEGGLFSVFTNGFNKLGQLVGKATSGGGVFGAIGKFFTGIGSKVTTSVLGTSGLKTVVTAALGKIPVIGPLLLGGTIALSAIGGGNIFKGISNVVTGIGKTLAKAVKGIGKGISKAAKGIGSMLSSVFHSVVGGTSSNGKKHKGIFGWKIWPWNWGKKASGDKSIKKSGAYNVDEKGEEIIVRQPQKGRVTTLEKGDGVIPANQTETLMGIAKNPIRWLRSNLAKVTGSTAVAVGATKDNADQEAVAQAQETAGKIDSVYSGAFSDIKKVSNAVMKSIKTGSGTIGKVIGGVTSGITGALIGFDSNKVTKSSNTLINSIKKAFDKFKNILGGGSSITGSMDKLLSSSKSKTLAQLDAMKSSFEKTWNEMAEATGVSKDDITATSKEMYDKMTKLVNDTYAAIGDNTALSSEQVEQLTQTLFKSMQSTYTSGWNRIASLTDEMTEEQANKMAIAYKSMSDGCTSTMNSVSRTMANSWNQCGGGVRNLSAKTESTISKAWADTTGNTEKMLYDMRACFDNSWGQAEQGVRNLADNTANTINGAYTSIKSTSDETINNKLPSDMANAWKNVEPGATDLSSNLDWTMKQAFNNITKGCNDTVTSIKSAFGTAGNDLYNKGQTTDTAKTEEKKKTTTTTTNSSSSSSGSSSSSQPVSGGQSLSDWFKNSLLAGAKEDYKKVKDKVTSSSAYQKASSAVNYVKDKVTSSSAYQKASSVVKDVKEKVSNSKPVKAISSFIDKHKKKASGARKINQPDVYNVDEQGSELMVRQPQAGRYTYLETGDGVVPADITSRLFEMGGNPDAWFQNQMSKYSAPVTSTGGSNLNVSMGNIVIQNPVGSADDLAGEIVRELPNKLSQYMNLR